MEHLPSTSSNDDGVLNSLPERPHIRYQIPLFQQQSVHSFSLQGIGSLNQGITSSPSQRLATLKAEPGNVFLSDLNNYIEFASDERLGTDSAGHVSFGALLKTGALPHALPTSCSSPEALLDAISLVQRKLQHLEAIVRSMIRGGTQHGTIQQNQSLSTEFTSIMSQLFAATSGFSAQSFQALSPASQVNDAFDFSFDAFNDDDMNTALGESFCPPSSGCSTLVDATSLAMKGGTELRIPAVMMDPRLKEMGPTTSTAATMTTNDAANAFTSVNAHKNIAESNLANGTPNGPPETGNIHGIHDMDAQVLMASEDHREDDDDGEGEVLPPGSYELVELAATEILAEHTHFCEICSKGFKRDANLRMHMRGHGDEYKTPAALARPDKTPRDPSMVKLRRYSCPYAGCKRNRKHQKFQPLKTMLCVKNHYRRSHCPKLLICSRCKTKKFSVVADLKTHEKHCGQDKWQCSCGTTFSRKDKLFGHIGLFVGHTPATPIHEIESAGAGAEATSAGFFAGFGEGLEGQASDKTVSLGTGGTSANDNSAASLSHGMDVPDVSGMGVRTHNNESSTEQSTAHRDKSLSFLNVAGGALMRDSSYPLAALASDGAELRNLLSESFFHQVDGMN